MNAELRTVLRELLGARVSAARRLTGGDINQAYALTLSDGRSVFVKTHPGPPAGMFAAEAKGLAWLREANNHDVQR